LSLSFEVVVVVVDVVLLHATNVNSATSTMGNDQLPSIIANVATAHHLVNADYAAIDN
jgi:hypothetical protein